MAGLQVAVIEDGVARIRKASVARDFGKEIEVRDGVKPGDQVILNPPVDLVEGSRVQARPQAQPRLLDPPIFGATCRRLVHAERRPRPQRLHGCSGISALLPHRSRIKFRAKLQIREMRHASPVRVLFGFGGLAVCALVMILIGNLSRPSARELNDFLYQASRSGLVRVARTSLICRNGRERVLVCARKCDGE